MKIAIIGLANSGKTTVFNIVTGLLAPSAGVIEFGGERLNGMTPHRVTRRGIARTFQNIRIFKEMTLIDNVAVALGSRPGYGALSALLPTAGWFANQLMASRSTTHGASSANAPHARSVG